MVNCIALYSLIDNKMVGFIVALVLSIGMAVWILQPIIHNFRSKEFEIIFNGFSIIGQGTYFLGAALFSAFLFLGNRFPPHLPFFCASLLIMTIEDGFKIITFDFAKKEVVGLFYEERKNADGLTIEYHENSDSPTIKITDNTGFFTLSKLDYSDTNWERIRTNLERIKSK